ncbi:uncharacterized protein BKCO1_1150002 [Diplodia corticola]|uniref:Extracellular mutant protein 11 C-terminal domain-containing protein n=1 Tax=Diplodia corticola TaxID=236234 RepID=A0A1J9QL04_9PEZI|nr:uncharacterized protein BKCO1_1150002 [Diplodia corticola]OJD28746.1 hypothetical protein BKCO1_1150002 [Diplodia corticola]
MHQFLNRGGRTASPVPKRSHTPPGRPSEAERRRLGQAARVDVPVADFDDTMQRGQNRQSPQRDISRQGQRPAVQPTAHRQTAHLHNYNAFDTDAENADDTTITSFSDEGAQGNLGQQNFYDNPNFHVQEDQESINDNESHFADGESDDSQGPLMHEMLYAAQRKIGEGKKLPMAQSYPSTTIPDDYDEGEEDVEGDYDGDEQHGPQSPELKNHVPYPTPQPPFRKSQPYITGDPLYQLRQEASKKIMSDTSLPVRSGLVQSEIPRPLSAKEVQQPHQQHQQHHHTQLPPSTQPGPKDMHTAIHARSSSTASNAETINERNFFEHRPSTAQKGPLSLSDSSSERIQDYEDEELFAMSYSDLDKQSFDDNPRADPNKQPISHLADSPLEDRLRTAYRELRPEDQSEFFNSLQIDEWEDAGDWFLDQFGDLLGRFKKARRTKRDVAREFEDEIRKRNDAVGRKRRCVEDEVGRIKGQGQRLLPDTPSRRRAATPAFTPRR